MAPKGVSTCWIERTYDCVVASGSLRGKISQMEVVEDFESRPHKAVSFVVERGKEMQEWNEQNLPKVPPGCSGRKGCQKKKAEKKGEVDEGGEEKKDQEPHLPRSCLLQASRRKYA